VLPPGFSSVTALIASDLIEVDRRFSAELACDIPSVQALLKHVSRFRGKMLRPVLLLLTAKAAGSHGGVNAQHHTLAAVVEMVHMATLVHDDVLDDAELRRKGPTINHLKGNEAAVMLGDLLISHAFHLCSSLDSQHASRLIGRTTNLVCEGELLQIDQRNNLDLTEAVYFEIIRRKTASLVAACCHLGAHYAGATPEQTAALERFGLCVGTAFQIQDDVLDLVGDPLQVGKTLGIDIEKGKLTLPLIHFLNTAPKEHRELLRSLLRGHDPDKPDQIRNLVLPSDSIPYARARAEALIAEARAALECLPPSDARSALDTAARFVTQRAV
jgi:octaprenyl-diphosphate synthase